MNSHFVIVSHILRWKVTNKITIVGFTVTKRYKITNMRNRVTSSVEKKSGVRGRSVVCAV